MKLLDCIDIVGMPCTKYNGIKLYISTGAVNIDHIEENNIDEVEYDKKPSRADVIVNEGDILFAKMQNTQKTLIIDKTLSNYIYSTGFYAVRAKENKINTKCLYYLLNSKQFLDKKDSLCTGATQKAINNTGLSQIEINIPSMCEQKKIVEELDNCKKIIDLRKQELQQLEELIKARFVEMIGTLTDNANSFSIVTINDVCDLIKDGTHQTPIYTDDKINGVKFLSSKDVMTQQICWDNIKYIPKELHQKLYATVKPQKNDILMSKNGVNYGVAAVNNTNEIFDIYVSLALLRPRNIIEPVYLRCVINSDETKTQFDACIKGIGVPNLHLGEIKKTQILLPPLPIQNKFVEFVEQIDKSKFIEINNKKGEKQKCLLTKRKHG